MQLISGSSFPRDWATEIVIQAELHDTHREQFDNLKILNTRMKHCSSEEPYCQRHTNIFPIGFKFRGKEILIT